MIEGKKTYSISQLLFIKDILEGKIQKNKQKNIIIYPDDKVYIEPSPIYSAPRKSHFPLFINAQDKLNQVSIITTAVPILKKEKKLDYWDIYFIDRKFNTKLLTKDDDNKSVPSDNIKVQVTI